MNDNRLRHYRLAIRWISLPPLPPGYTLDAATPAPSGEDVSAISAAKGLPIIGAYAPAAAAHLRSLAKGGSSRSTRPRSRPRLRIMSSSTRSRARSAKP